MSETLKDIRTTVSGIKGLVMILQAYQRDLADKGEPDPSEGSLDTAKVAIEQLKEKIETIVGPEEPAGAEGFEVEDHENEDQPQAE
jgi:hypothetical protein